MKSRSCLHCIYRHPEISRNAKLYALILISIFKLHTKIQQSTKSRHFLNALRTVPDIAVENPSAPSRQPWHEEGRDDVRDHARNEAGVH